MSNITTSFNFEKIISTKKKKRLFTMKSHFAKKKRHCPLATCWVANEAKCKELFTYGQSLSNSNSITKQWMKLCKEVFKRRKKRLCNNNLGLKTTKFKDVFFFWDNCFKQG